MEILITMKKIILLLTLSFYTTQSISSETLTFGIVPQQSASKLAKLWTPIIEHINNKTGLSIKFATAKNIPSFEERLAKGEYDFAYMNPYHFTVYNQKPGYHAIAKASNKSIKGILVTKKNSSIKNLQDLENSTIAFPAPAAFAATILTQADLLKSQVNFSSKYVSSHDSVYRSVAKGIYSAGGGVVRTFKNVDPKINEQLNILWTTKGYTPHAISYHPNISENIALKIQQVLVEMANSKEGKKLLRNIKISGFEKAVDSDWDDVRQLNIRLINPQ